MLIRGLLCALIALQLSSLTWAGEPSCALNKYGGWSEKGTVPSGCFRTSRADGRWWLVDPEGHRFLSVGVNRIQFRPESARGVSRNPYAVSVVSKYGRRSRWAAAVVERLRQWGFNTVGASSDPVARRQEMPYVVALNLAGAAALRTEQGFPDVFDPSYPRAVSQAVRRSCRGITSDRWLLGYFTDDELPWGDAESDSVSLFVGFLGLPDYAAGRQALASFLRARYGSIARLNESWRTDYEDFGELGRTPQVGSHIPVQDQNDFLRILAYRYFRTAHEAIREFDDHHLILGCRFRGSAPRPVLEAVGGYVDLISLDHTGDRPDLASIRRISEITGRPILISSLCLGPGETETLGQPEEGPHQDSGRTQAERFERCVTELMALPMVVGYHWCRHADESPGAALDGETGRWGLVDVNDEPHAQFVDAATRINGTLYLHAAEAVAEPAGQ